jgi:DNA-binding transcriptional ArsR family regulator
MAPLLRPVLFKGRERVEELTVEQQLGSVRQVEAAWLEGIADPVRLGILRSLSEVSEATASDLATWGQASSQTLRRHLDALVALGVIDEHPAESDGETPGRPAARFSLPQTVRDSVRAVIGPSRVQASFASISSIAATGPMNGARAT